MATSGSADAAAVKASAGAVPGALAAPEPHPALATRLVKRLGIRYPIIQTGMGWVSGANLTAATAEAGALGILASATMTIEELEAAIAKVKERTPAPFGVNLRADAPDVEARIELMIAERIAVASFAQAPRKDLIAKLRAGGLLTIPSIGAPRHAEKVAEWGVDGVIAQGGEGGGHTGSIPTSLLVPEVVAAARRTAKDSAAGPMLVIAAGGYYSGAGLVSALAYGADGIAMGTRFLLSAESQVPPAVKQAYFEAGLASTVVTKAVDGYPQRVIETPMVRALIDSTLTRLPRALANALRFRALTDIPLADMVKEGREMHRSAGLSWSQVAMAGNAPMLTKATLVDGDLEAGVLPTGQVAGIIQKDPSVAMIIAGIINEANEVLERLAASAGTEGS